MTKDQIEAERTRFEEWAILPPREFDIHRHDPNGAWPGNYKSYPVECAWQGWLAAKADAVPAWIACSERLPKLDIVDATPCEIGGKKVGSLLQSERVLIFAPDHVHGGLPARPDRWAAIEGREIEAFWYNCRSPVTHWMPLPADPQGAGS